MTAWVVASHEFIRRTMTVWNVGKIVLEICVLIPCALFRFSIVRKLIGKVVRFEPDGHTEPLFLTNGENQRKNQYRSANTFK